ncbi:MAG TPA: HAMP domain-containing sensor histidine kinase [Thermoanaerobaculia bacterium]|jgi:signal transduction histidine kinase
MNKATTVVITLVSIALATLLFYAFLHRVSSVWLDVAVHPEVRGALVSSMEEEKRLAQLDPANREQYRASFERNRKLVARIDVIRHSREAMLRQFELTLVAVFLATLCSAAAVWFLRQRRVEAQKRREYAERLASWQEAARRHAHEIRTPLTAARLELDRVVSLVRDGAALHEVEHASESVLEELQRIARFTREFSSFGALNQPVLQEVRLDDLVAEFCETFAGAWPGLALRFDRPQSPAVVQADRDLLRQVLVNLCTNSARAGADAVRLAITRDGERVALYASDSGSGISDAIRPRIFDPYVTTRKIGEGMGLGLAISRKILLDHGGDLDLIATGPNGTTFRMALPA